MNDKNKFTKMIIEGQIVDLSKMSTEELYQLRKTLENKKMQIRNEIDKILKIDTRL